MTTKFQVCVVDNYAPGKCIVRDCDTRIYDDENEAEFAAEILTAELRADDYANDREPGFNEATVIQFEDHTEWLESLDEPPF